MNKKTGFRMKLVAIQLLSLFCFCSFASLGQEVNPEAYKAWKALQDSPITKFMEIPIPLKYIELCKTEFGRNIILQTLDTITKKDLYLQWAGIDYQRQMLKKDHLPHPDSVTFRDYILEFAKQTCTPFSGIVYEPIYYGLARYTGGPGQVQRMGCTSANSGGSHSGDCNFTQEILVPPGYEACRLFYNVTRRRHGRYNIIPIQWVTDNRGDYPRFRGYRFTITGHGDEGNVSEVYFSDVATLVVLENTPSEIRRKCKCDIPIIPLTDQPVINTPITNPKPVSLEPAKLQWSMVDARENAEDLVVFNSGQVMGRLHYIVNVLDGDNGEYKFHAEGEIDVPPRGDSRVGFHKWRAKKFKLIYAQPVVIP